MPDAWEQTYGLNPLDPADAALDNDGDGATNLEEFVAGTDPNSAGAVVYGAEVLIDLHTGTIAPGNWNSLAGGVAYEGYPLIDEHGNSSGYALTADAWSPASSSHTGGLSGSFPWPAQVAAQCWYATSARSVTIAGFTPGDEVHVEVLNRHTYQFGAYTDIGVNGDVHPNINPFAYESGDREVWTSAYADAEGNIVVDFDFGSLGGTYIEASAISFKVRSTSSGPVGDEDGDGMPTSWETLYGLDPLDASDATLDPDADGRDNLTEYLLGSDPLVPDSGVVAGKVLIDLHSGPGSFPDWNVFNAGIAHNAVQLANESGELTNFTFTSDAWLAASSSQIGGLGTAYPWPTDVARYGWYHTQASTIRLGGFVPGAQVQVEVMVRHTYNLGAYTDVGIHGDVHANVDPYANSAGDFEVWSTAIADSNGEILVDFSMGSLGGSYLLASAIIFEVVSQ